MTVPIAAMRACLASGVLKRRVWCFGELAWML